MFPQIIVGPSDLLTHPAETTHMLNTLTVYAHMTPTNLPPSAVDDTEWILLKSIVRAACDSFMMRRRCYDHRNSWQ